MRQVTLGASGVTCGALGLGCMGMSEFYGEQDDAQSLKTLDRALELGITLYDTSDMYGRGHNEELVGRFAKGRRDRIVIASKFGIIRDPNGPSGSLYDRELDNSRGYMRRCVEASLQRLRTDHLDLYYVHRMDPRRPIEETMSDLADLVREGKIRAIGLSEVGVDILRRAASIHPVAALQSEYSLFHRDVETEVLPACRELGIAFVPYSPLGRGFLTGAITSTSSLAGNDLRINAPRFQDGNIEKNLALLEQVKAIASAKTCTLGQVALAWLFAQGDDIVPIPGTKRIKYLEENVGAISLHLTTEEAASISNILSSEGIAGSRDWKAPAADATCR
ncbi:MULTISPECIES: aldo/keto reductase [unclassified Chelatococcus]|uniref:aldo/keto reductase n=1 Tax=unclassified Chelatococcus TaxID=2638111 RepID=UPI001BD093AB|nr:MULTISPECIES: aldo/keto reductase [unclassified Chelatococcus]MBS7700228.1 aldo/keto reductase [Chelatococcus sp. YT9]MBX3558199.1 aldo/keto reductase [Chelatococcus sp.]